MPADAVQWVVTGYAISFGGLLILGGRAADLLGRRRMFVAGLVAFSLASLAGGLAQDPVLLIAARVVQGAGAAIVAPAALSLITTGFPEGPERTRAIGLYGAVSSVGFVVRPGSRRRAGAVHQLARGVPGQRPGRPDRRRPVPGHPRPRQAAETAARRSRPRPPRRRRRRLVARRAADHQRGHAHRVRRVPGRRAGLDLPAGHRRRRDRGRGDGRLRQGRGQAPGTADPACRCCTARACGTGPRWRSCSACGTAARCSSFPCTCSRCCTSPRCSPAWSSPRRAWSGSSWACSGRGWRAG